MKEYYDLRAPTADLAALVETTVRPDHEEEEIQMRQLPDGTVWPVLKRYFTPASLSAELGGGETLHHGPWFVVVRA